MIYLSNNSVIVTGYATYLKLASVCSRFIFISKMSKVEVCWGSVTFWKCKTQTEMLPSAGRVVENIVNSRRMYH